MAKPIKTPEQKARDRRSVAIALSCAAFAILVFVISVVRMGGAHNIAPTF
jgi:hypothetical protein